MVETGKLHLPELHLAGSEARNRNGGDALAFEIFDRVDLIIVSLGKDDSTKPRRIEKVERWVEDTVLM